MKRKRTSTHGQQVHVCLTLFRFDFLTYRLLALGGNFTSFYDNSLACQLVCKNSFVIDYVVGLTNRSPEEFYLIAFINKN